MYNNIDHDTVDQKQTTYDSLYTLADNKPQLGSELEDLDWISTDSHKDEPIIASEDKVGNKILCPRAFYDLYVKPNKESNGHLIYRLATDQIVVTKDYWIVRVPGDLDNTICETEPYENKSQVDDVDKIQSIVHANQSNNYDNNNHTSINNEDQYM